MTAKRATLSLLVVLTGFNLSLTAPLSDTVAVSGSTRVRILHIPPATIRSDTVTYLSCVLESVDLQLHAFSIFLRNDEEENLKEIPLTYHRGAYCVKLIPEMLHGKYLYYFFLAEFSDGRVVALPSTDPEKMPFKVPINKKKR